MLIHTDMAKEIFTNNSRVSISSSRHTWFMFGLYLHVITLYVTVYLLHSEVQLTKQNINDMTVNFINITKEVELQMKFMKHISSQVCAVNSILNRKKREIFSNKTQLESGGFSSKPKDHINRNGNHDRRNHSERRGKKNKKKNRRKRGHGFLPQASLFIGAIPEPVIRDGGLIAPWLLHNEAIKDFGLVTKVPTMSRDSIEIVETGLYFIYAQVYYISIANMTKAHNSFLIMKKLSSGSDKTLAKCAVMGNVNVGGEISCFTAIAQTLLTGDIIYLKQRERDRHIIMTPGQTFLGFILLNKKSN